LWIYSTSIAAIHFCLALDNSKQDVTTDCLVPAFVLHSVMCDDNDDTRESKQGMKRAEVDVGKFYEQVVETTVKSGRKKRTLSVRLRGDAVGSSSPTSRVAFCILIDLFMTRLLIVCSALARSYDDNCDVDRLGLAVLNALCRNPTVARTAASAAAME